MGQTQEQINKNLDERFLNNTYVTIRYRSKVLSDGKDSLSASWSTKFKPKEK
jgi:hypothetical protein